jgi:GT2 family glycosyltransferase
MNGRTTSTKEAIAADRRAGSTPTVSVVIPAYNACQTLADALDSVAAQDFPALEAVVADDASSDGTADLARRWASAQRGCTIQVLQRGTNGGPAAARNCGIAAARGEWVAFLDADDVWLPWKLRSQLELVGQHPHAVAFCGGMELVRCDGASRTRAVAEAAGKPVAAPGSRLISLEVLSTYNPVVTSTVLVRKDALAAVGGFDEQFRGPEDYDLWLRLAARQPLVMINTPLVRYRTRADGLSLNDRTFLPQVLRVIDKAYGAGGVLDGRAGKRKAQAYQMLSCSWSAAQRGASRRALTLFLKSLFVWPGSFGPHAHRPWGRSKLLSSLLRAAWRDVKRTYTLSGSASP